MRRGAWILGAAGGRGDVGDDAAQHIRPGIAARSGRIELVAEDVRKLGPLIIDPPARTVRHADGRSASLEPRTMQVLIALLQAGGAVVSKDELVERCWDGRIVGDDSVSSVVYRLRRDLRDIIDGVFEIETVTKVGFRIVRVAAAPEAPAAAPVEPGPGAASPQAALRPARRPLAIALAVAVAILAALAILAVWPRADRFAADRPIEVRRYAALGPVDRAVPASLKAELSTALTGLDVPVGSVAGSLILHGSVRRTGDTLTITSNLDDPAAGRVVWTGQQHVPAHDGPALTAAMMQVAGTLECGRLALNPADGLSPANIALFFRYCEHDVAVRAPGELLQIARRLVASVPDFAPAWLIFAEVAGLPVWSPQEAPVRTREGLEGTRRFIALRPDLGDGYVFQAVLFPADRPIERERLLRKAADLPYLRCDCASQFLGDFLIQTGRAEEGLAAYLRGRDWRRPQLLALWRQVMGHDLTGRRSEADRLARQMEALHRNDPRVLRMRRLRALWHRDWQEAARFSFSEMDRVDEVMRVAVRSLGAGQAERDAAIRQMRQIQIADADLVTALSLFALLGDRDSAFVLLERSRRGGATFSAPGRYPGMSRALLWDPTLRSLWYDPRFPTFLARAGFISYWRASRTRPDICGEAAPPVFCRLI